MENIKINKKKLTKAISNLQYTINRSYDLNLPDLLIGIYNILIILAPSEVNINMSMQQTLPIISKIINRNIQNDEQILPVAKELIIAAKRYI